MMKYQISTQMLIEVLLAIPDYGWLCSPIVHCILGLFFAR